jgi:hypothetical protein
LIFTFLHTVRLSHIHSLVKTVPYEYGGFKPKL